MEVVLVFITEHTIVPFPLSKFVQIWPIITQTTTINNVGVVVVVDAATAANVDVAVAATAAAVGVAAAPH